MATENLLNLKVHKLSKESYESLEKNDQVDTTAIYLTPDEGYVTAGQKADTSLGAKATAEGNNVTASGANAHAEGLNTTASQQASHAEGSGTTASGARSHAEGHNTTAYGGQSHAEGRNTTALSSAAHAEGESTNKAIGYTKNNNTITADSSNDIIKEVWEAGTYAFSLAKGNGSHVEGTCCLALGKSAHAEGDATIAETGAHAEGCRTEAIGVSAHAEGCGTLAQGLYSHAEGSWTTAMGESSHAEGTGSANPTDYGISPDTSSESIILSWCDGEYGENASHWFALAHGKASHIEGMNGLALGDYSHVEGSGNLAKDFCAHAEGSATAAEGAYSHAEGFYSRATNYGAHAEGGYYDSDDGVGWAGGHASGPAAHAEGIGTVAGHIASHTAGKCTKTSRANQTVVGEYNADDTNALFIVGNGRGEIAAERSNAFVVHKDGSAYVGGHYTPEGTKISGEKVATEGKLVIGGTTYYLQAGTEGTINPADGYITFILE